MAGEIKGGVVRFKGVGDVERLMFDANARDIFLIEFAEEFRILESAVRLSDEVVDLV